MGKSLPVRCSALPTALRHGWRPAHAEEGAAAAEAALELLGLWLLVLLAAARAGGRGFGWLFLAFLVGLGPLGLLAREADLALAAVDAEDLDLDLVADLDDFLGAVDLVVGQLGDVEQALEARLELDEDAEVGQLGDLPLDDVARLVAARGCRSPTGRRGAA